MRYAVATDSSHLEAEIDPASASSGLPFMQLAAVITDLERIETREGLFMDAVAMADARSKAMLS